MTSPRLVSLRPRPNTTYLSQGRCVLATDNQGCLDGRPERGMFFHETRVLSVYRYYINGRLPVAATLSNVEQHSWLAYYINTLPVFESQSQDHGSGSVKTVSQYTLELRASRYIGNGMHEDIDLTNYTQAAAHFEFAIEIDADFIGQLESTRDRLQKGELTRKWDSKKHQLIFHYQASHKYEHQDEAGFSKIHRGLIIEFSNFASEPESQNNFVRFQIDLPPAGKWHMCIDFLPVMEDEVWHPGYGCRSFAGIKSEMDQRRSIFFSESTQLTVPFTETLSNSVCSTFEQARVDLAALRLFDLDIDERTWIMAAGLPMYIAIFGRDTLTAAWQSALINPRMMQGALSEMAKWQGRETNDWRDEDPGRMIHEAHTGPLELLNYNPRKRYYGSITTSGFYPVILAELWHWTGNKEIVRPFINPAKKALQWLDSIRESNGGRFYAYKTRSVDGVRHQAWKDSADAIVYPDGSQVEPPIATCEEQAFVYLAKFLLSEVLWWMDEKDEAKILYSQADELKKRFNERFWMEKENFIALGLDSKNEQIASISSNPGHCIAAGIVDAALIQQVADRFMQEDLFSGWGIRTLSSKHPAYNPHSYHRGSIWPVEQGSFAIGFARYGLHTHLERLAKVFFESAALFAYFRLPELFTGHPRDDDHPFPAIYLQANSPQAWSSSAVFSVLQSILGLYPYAPLNLLLIDPHLPEWLPDITLSNLHVGQARCDIRFYRMKNGKSEYEILRKEGSLHVVRQPSPWSLTTGYAERVRDLLNSFL